MSCSILQFFHLCRLSLFKFAYCKHYIFISLISEWEWIYSYCYFIFVSSSIRSLIVLSILFICYSISGTINFSALQISLLLFSIRILFCIYSFNSAINSAFPIFMFCLLITKNVKFINFLPYFCNSKFCNFSRLLSFLSFSLFVTELMAL